MAACKHSSIFSIIFLPRFLNGITYIKYIINDFDFLHQRKFELNKDLSVLKTLAETKLVNPR